MKHEVYGLEFKGCGDEFMGNGHYISEIERDIYRHSKGDVVGDFEIIERTTYKNKDKHGNIAKTPSYVAYCTKCNKYYFKFHQYLRRCYFHSRGKQTPYKYEVGDIVNLKLKVVERFFDKRSQDSKRRVGKYKYKCVDCGYSSTTSEDSLNVGNSCPCCSPTPKVVVEHINSIVANEETHWMVDYFQGGWNEAKLYTPRSNKKIKLKCPICGFLKSKSLDNLHENGFGCGQCSDGKSYPERYVASVLQQLHLEYECEKVFEWSTNGNGAGARRYDFYIPSENMIIETHGEQHYNGRWDRKRGTSDLIKEQENDNLKRSLALENKVAYIVIDCRKSKSDWIKTSVERELKTIYDLSQMDWKKCHMNAISSIISEVCRYYMTTTKDVPLISKHFGIGESTVRRYLKTGRDAGLCDFLGLDGLKKPINVYKMGEFVGEFESMNSLQRESLNHPFIGTILYQGKVSTAIKLNKAYKGFTFTLATV